MTSILELSQYTTLGSKYIAKLEGENPTGSLKDRMVPYTLRSYEKAGLIHPGDAIVEASSGNTGIALAFWGLQFGYQIIICVDSRVCIFKKNKIKELGAELIECDCTQDSEACIKAASKIGKSSKAFWFNQFDNPFHVHAYYETLGNEVVQQLNTLSIRIDYLIAGLGSGGSILGLGYKLRQQHNAALKVFAVSPLQNPTLIEGLHPGHIRGDFPIWTERDSNFESERIFVSDDKALKQAIDLASKGSISVGPCSGAVMYTALNEIFLQGNYLLLFSDRGDRYQELYQNFLDSASTPKLCS